MDKTDSWTVLLSCTYTRHSRRSHDVDLKWEKCCETCEMFLHILCYRQQTSTCRMQQLSSWSVDEWCSSKGRAKKSLRMCDGKRKFFLFALHFELISSLFASTLSESLTMSCFAELMVFMKSVKRNSFRKRHVFTSDSVWFIGWFKCFTCPAFPGGLICG